MKREKKKRVFSIPKMAHMLPTLREKKRYLVYEVITNKEITKQDAENAVKQAIKEFIGDYGMAKANIRFMKDWLNNKGIIKVNNKETDKVKAAMALIKLVNGNKAIVKSVGMSGILNKARKKYLKEA